MKEHLSQRKQLNPKYSMRCFARDMDIPSSHMSKILRGLQGMSAARAEKICEKLKIEGIERSYFIDLVLASDARSKKGKMDAAKRLETYDVDQLEIAQFVKSKEEERLDFAAPIVTEAISNIESTSAIY